MNKVEKEVTQAQLKDEERALKELKRAYTQARKDVKAQISALNARTDMQNLQSIIYQKQYQQALLKQIEGVLDDLNKGQYKTMQDFLQGSYANGYIGSMYNLESQGIPMTVPIDPVKMEKAIKTDSKLSKSYYQNRILPENLTKLKKSIRTELTRGIASGKTWLEVAYQIAEGMNSPFNRALNDAMRIVRTEGHRINQQGFLDAGDVAKNKGADIVKQWDATLDSVTRPWHQEADGQIREWDDFFLVHGEQMKAPSVGGSASNVINCRCQLLQRARWALDEDELQTLKDRANFFGLDKTNGFEDFKKKYIIASEATKDEEQSVIIKTLDKLKNSGMNDADYEEYLKVLNEHSNSDIRNLYSKYADGIESVKYTHNDGVYMPRDNTLKFSYPNQTYIDSGTSKYSTLAHEYGHYFDRKVEFELSFKEMDALRDGSTLAGDRFIEHLYPKVASSSDEFLEAVRKDKERLRSIWTRELTEELRANDASAGVQDAIDGLFTNSRIKWGHGEKYYNHKYSIIKQFNDEKAMQSVYKSLGLDASNQAKTKMLCRQYEAASEMWANIMSAEVNGGKELEYVKEYLPNSYEALKKIIKGAK